MVHIFNKPRNRFVFGLIIATISAVWDLRGTIDKLQVQIDKVATNCYTNGQGK